jgi:hypothetical protein
MQGAPASTVTLQPFQPSHLALLAAWLRAAHVARWYPRPEDDLARAMKPPAGGVHAVIIARQYDPNGLGPCHLMVRDLRAERGSPR